MHLSNHQLLESNYLELLLSSDLSWSQHIETTCTKAKKLWACYTTNFTTPPAYKLWQSSIYPL